MNTKVKNIVNVAVMLILVFGFAVLCLVLPKPEFLDSERREPAAFPELNLESIMKDGNDYGDSFMKKFDDKYTPDNFPFRDVFRDIKGFVVNYVFNHKDKDGVFMVDGYISEMQEEIDKGSIEHAASKLEAVYNKYLKDKGISPYISIIPDKSYFIAAQNGYLSMDYEEFVKQMTASVDFAKYIDIMSALELEDYYKTDTHWRQENLVDIAGILVNAMGGSYTSQFTANPVDYPFYGVYSNRVGRPVDPETVYWLWSDYMKDVKVYDWESGMPRPMELYNMSKAESLDSYDMYLGGEKSLVTIENPNAKTDRELVIFRDSYGRSIIPLLTEDYAKITIIDIRYNKADNLIMAGGVRFNENTDVLFLYSSLVLNASSEMK